MDENREILDRIASKLKTAESRNTLHACREGHPLGRDNKWKWRNLRFVLLGLHHKQKPCAADMAFVEQMATAEDFDVHV